MSIYRRVVPCPMINIPGRARRCLFKSSGFRMSSDSKLKMSPESTPCLSEGVSVEEIEGDVNKAFDAGQIYYKRGFVRFQPSGQVFPREFTLVEKEVTEFSVRDDDVWVSSFPKAGTTWTQEMVWNISNNVDIDTAKKSTLEQRFPFVEMSGLFEEGAFEKHMRHMVPEGTKILKSSMELATVTPSPRLLKTHLSTDMLPRELMEKNVKLIYVARNPRDVCVSYHNHWRFVAGYRGSWETFFDAFVGDVCGSYTPFMQHVLGYWRLRDKPNILFITYEEMKKDLPSVIRKTADFLEKSLTDDQIESLTDHLMFKNMKKNKAVNKEEAVAIQRKLLGADDLDFMRKGETGDWRNHMSLDQVKRIEEWEDRHLMGTGLRFVYDI